MEEQFSRTAMLLGRKGTDTLRNSKIIVFGVGGVGSFTIEALARCGLNRLDVVDGDSVSVSNINRQIIALHSTVGRKKVEVAKERISDIAPFTQVSAYDIFYKQDTKNIIDLSIYDYIVDAIDMIDSKVLLIKEAKKLGIPIISSLSTGNKINTNGFLVSDIYETSVCPIAKIMRKRLRQENIDTLKVIYSTEPPVPLKEECVDLYGKKTVGSVSFVPSVVGLMLAGEVVRDLIELSEKK